MSTRNLFRSRRSERVIYPKSYTHIKKKKNSHRCKTNTHSSRRSEPKNWSFWILLNIVFINFSFEWYYAHRVSGKKIEKCVKTVAQTSMKNRKKKTKKLSRNALYSTSCTYTTRWRKRMSRGVTWRAESGRVGVFFRARADVLADMVDNNNDNETYSLPYPHAVFILLRACTAPCPVTLLYFTVVGRVFGHSSRGEDDRKTSHYAVIRDWREPIFTMKRRDFSTHAPRALSKQRFRSVFFFILIS